MKEIKKTSNFNNIVPIKIIELYPALSLDFIIVGLNEIVEGRGSRGAPAAGSQGAALLLGVLGGQYPPSENESMFL